MKRCLERCSGKVLWKGALERCSGKPGRKPGKESEKVVPFCLERCQERCLKRYGVFIPEKWSGKELQKVAVFPESGKYRKICYGGVLSGKGRFPDWKGGWKGAVERGLERRVWRFWKDS
jgi:hypothetical protein